MHDIGCARGMWSTNIFERLATGKQPKDWVALVQIRDSQSANIESTMLDFVGHPTPNLPNSQNSAKFIKKHFLDCLF